MFIDFIIIILIFIIMYLINCRTESYVPISKDNIKLPPYQDNSIIQEEDKRLKKINKYEDDLKSNYYFSPVIGDIPINIIYDKLTE